MELIAKKSLRYAGRSLVEGDKFEASAKDARLLKAIGKAVDAPAEMTHEDAHTGYDAGAAGHERQGRKGNYRTRRLKAADATSKDDATEE
ncbi:hypothetical protein [Shinella sp.]|uniref:DUF7210 family protein n=1 Tax=Shinella sp. TaxID=1870904 RepID=UPI0028A7BBA6|nr:hypothetical protein [Shinella sp.]